MAMLIRTEISRENLEIKYPELLLTPSSFKECIKPILIIAGSIGSYDCVATEQTVEPITDFSNFFPLLLQHVERMP